VKTGVWLLFGMGVFTGLWMGGALVAAIAGYWGLCFVALLVALMLIGMVWGAIAAYEEEASE
jgi:hypothetical protein